MTTRTPTRFVKPPPTAEPTEEARRERLRALGQMIKKARGLLSQEDLGKKLGGLPQTTLSRWEQGKVELTVEQIRDIERACNARPGTLLMGAGYVEAGFTSDYAEEVLRADPAIHPAVRDDVIAMYEGFVRLSKRLYAADPAPKGPASTRRRS